MRILGPVIAMTIATAAAAETRITLEARTGLAVTVYGNGLALVTETRGVAVEPGENRLSFEGVTRRMLPASAVLQATGGNGLSVAELAYDFDVLTPAALLARSVGKEVGIVRTHPTTGEETVESAHVLSADGGTVLRFRDRIETGSAGRIVFRELPPDLRPLPALVGTVDSDSRGAREVTLSYLSEGLTWSADYVAWIDDAQSRLDLFGRAMLTNASGLDLPDAALALVAGEVRRVPTARPTAGMAHARMPAEKMADAAPPEPSEEGFADLYLYRLQRPVSLPDRQTKQLALLSAPNLAVTREFVSEGSMYGFGSDSGEARPSHPTIELKVRNPADGGAGKPLPAGIVRIYSRDASGAPRLIGEDTIPHTPVGNDLMLSPARAFDISVVRRQTDFVRAGLPQDVFESAWSIEIRNARNDAATVRLVESYAGSWTMLSESAKHQREGADRAVWRLNVPAQGTATLTYRVRIQR
jgi:hypothetical protein